MSFSGGYPHDSDFDDKGYSQVHTACCEPVLVGHQEELILEDGSCTSGCDHF